MDRSEAAATITAAAAAASVAAAAAKFVGGVTAVVAAAIADVAASVAAPVKLIAFVWRWGVDYILIVGGGPVPPWATVKAPLPRRRSCFC